MYKSELVIKQYKGMLDYLEKKTGFKFEIVYHADYAQLLQAIVDKKVDIAHLGPLPYANLLQKPNHQSTPIVQFLDKKGASTYTCSFITHNRYFAKDLSFEPVALTQPLSTCGFLSVSHLLEKYDLNLKNLNYHYSGTHSHVVLDLVIGDAQSGGVKTSEYTSYKHLGLQELDKTDPFPGFLWVGSAALKQKDLELIQKILTQIKPLQNLKDQELTKNWGSNVKYGTIKADAGCYEPIVKMLKQTDIPELQ